MLASRMFSRPIARQVVRQPLAVSFVVVFVVFVVLPFWFCACDSSSPSDTQPIDCEWREALQAVASDRKIVRLMLCCPLFFLSRPTHFVLDSLARYDTARRSVDDDLLTSASHYQRRRRRSSRYCLRHCRSRHWSRRQCGRLAGGQTGLALFAHDGRECAPYVAGRVAGTIGGHVRHECSSL